MELSWWTWPALSGSLIWGMIWIIVVIFLSKFSRFDRVIPWLIFISVIPLLTVALMLMLQVIEYVILKLI